MKVLLLPKLDSQFPKFCGQFQGWTFMPLSQVILAGKRACSQPAPASKVPHICADNQTSWWPVAVAPIRSSLQHVNLEQA